jgi:hypothetical protein
MEQLKEAEGSRVVVTWVGPDGSVDLRERGIDESNALICDAGWPQLQTIGIALRCRYRMKYRRGDVVLVPFPILTCEPRNGSRRWLSSPLSSAQTCLRLSSR